MKKTIHFLCLAALIGLAACSQKKDKYEQIAIDFCACMKPMADFQKEIEAMMSEGRQEDMMAMLMKGQQLDADNQACMMALQEKHGDIQDEEEGDKIEQAIRKACPDIVALMEEGAPGPGLMPEDFMEDEEEMDEGEEQ